MQWLLLKKMCSSLWSMISSIELNKQDNLPDQAHSQMILSDNSIHRAIIKIKCCSKWDSKTQLIQIETLDLHREVCMVNYFNRISWHLKWLRHNSNQKVVVNHLNQRINVLHDLKIWKNKQKWLKANHLNKYTLLKDVMSKTRNCRSTNQEGKINKLKLHRWHHRSSRLRYNQQTFREATERMFQ